MENLYRVLQDPSIENLHSHEIEYFDAVIAEFPSDYKKIISYINECFNYKSPLIVEEKSWGKYLNERFRVNKLPEELRPALIEYESPTLVVAIYDFLTYQKDPQFETLIARQNLRKSVLGTIQSSSATLSDKKTANELLSNLDNEINELFERMRSDQKKIGNYAGYDDVKNARAKIKVAFIDFVA